MIRIRLRRVGAKRQPSYRIVVADSRSPRDGRFIEKIGFYNPRTQPKTIEVNEARVLHWLSTGAQPSDTVERLLNTVGTLGRFQRLRAGEAMDELVAEAEQEFASRAAAQDPRTRRDDVAVKSLSRRSKARVSAEAEAPAAAPAMEAVEEPEIESEAEVEIDDTETEAAEEAVEPEATVEMDDTSEAESITEAEESAESEASVEEEAEPEAEGE